MYMLVMHIICPTLQRGCFLCDVHGILQFTMQERPKPTSKAAAAAQQIGTTPFLCGYAPSIKSFNKFESSITNAAVLPGNAIAT